MINKFIGVTTLSSILLFGSFVQTEVDAAAGMPEENNQQNEVQIEKDNNRFNNFNSYFKGFKIVCQNGQFKVVKRPQFENERVEVPTEQQDNNNGQEESIEQPNNNTEQEESIEQPNNNNEQEESVEQPEVEENKDVNVENDSLNQFEREVFELTNNERVKYGLAPLQIDYEVSRVAREKSRDMAVNGYFDHNSPTYGSPFDMMRSYGISYRTAGENIAKGQRSPQEVVTAWMNSQGHRENILNGNFTHIGIGYVEQGNVWTQQFIGK